MARTIKRRRFPRQRRLKENPQRTASALSRWLIVLLSWLALAGFCFTVPPQQWWQITAGLLLFSTSLFLTVRAASQNLALSLAIASLITLLAILKLFNLLTPTIFALTILIIILAITNYFL